MTRIAIPVFSHTPPTPISEREPCGPSLEYDHEFAVLLARLVPRTDAQYGSFVGTPEAPNWAEIERDCRRLLLRTQDINLLVWLCRARTKLGQASGLAQALGALRAVLQAWPEAVHPQLLIDGEREPAVRANALGALADPDGLLGDVGDLVVCTGTALRLTVRDVERALAIPRLPEALSASAVTQQLAELRAAGSAALAGTSPAAVHGLAQAAEHVQAIDAWARHQLGDDAPSLQPLLHVLGLFVPPVRLAASNGVLSDAAQADPGTEVGAEVGTEIGIDAGTEAGAAPSDLTGPGPAVRAASSHPGASRPMTPSRLTATRAEVQQTLRAARQWFETHEPSSPVAVLLQQAERLVGKRFSQVVESIPLELLRKWEADQDEAVAP